MPVYQYRGYKADGASATGIVDAESPKVARLKLRKDGVFPTEMAEQEGATKTVIPRSSSGLSAGVARSAVLTVTDVALMTRQLATLLVAGLPLVDALGVLMDQTEKKGVKGLLADVREAIRGGASYSAVLERYPRDFSSIYVHMVRAGEASGALDQILFRLAEFLEKQLALKNKVTNAILYPAIMLVVGTLVLFFLVTFVVPKITAVFAHSKQALPWPTIVLMEISQFCSDYWMVLLAGILTGIWGLRRFKNDGDGPCPRRPAAPSASIDRSGGANGLNFAVGQYVGHDALERRAIIRGARCIETGHEQPRARTSRRRGPAEHP